jgi:hypothetical protein
MAIQCASTAAAAMIYSAHYRPGLPSGFFARFGYAGPGTVAVPGVTDPLCRGAAPKQLGRGGSVGANVGLPTIIIITAVTVKTLIRGNEGPSEGVPKAMITV